jgi:clorobiocin biosynthesis protein CloN6
LEDFIARVASSNFKTVSYEHFHLPSDRLLKWMSHANPRTTITLSPDSHDPNIARLAGRGAYSNEELEAWIERALEAGIFQIDIWYFVGMPEQDEASVMKTAEYCARLLKKFQKARVNPLICPMIPYLDPGSTFFVEPEQHGYQVFYRTVEEHRRAAERASLINRINYETRWLKRADLVRVGYKAIQMVMQAKADNGFFPSGMAAGFNKRIDDTLDFLCLVDAVDNLKDLNAREQELEKLGDEIERRNNTILFEGVANQAFPINRKIGGRWFDELVWDTEVLDRLPGA